MCRNSNEPYFYKYANLMNRINNNRYEIECEKSLYAVNIIDLLDEVTATSKDKDEILYSILKGYGVNPKKIIREKR